MKTFMYAHFKLSNVVLDAEDFKAVLRNLLSSRTTSYLDPDEKNSQFQRSRSFVDGLSQASEEFRTKFKIIARGMSRSYWAESPEALANVGGSFCKTYFLKRRKSLNNAKIPHETVEPP